MTAVRTLCWRFGAVAAGFIVSILSVPFASTFGAHQENRVELSRGRGVVLAPRQKGDALNYFVYPYGELDGVKYATMDTTYSYSDTAR